MAIQAEGLDLYTIDTNEDISYSKKMLKTISMLYAGNILDANVFEKWYQLHKIGLQRVDIKYTLMTVFLEKFKSGLITWDQFLGYYDELELKSNLEEYILELYFENIPTKTEPLLSKDEFVKYYDELVYWNNTVEEKFKRILFDKLQSETDPLSYEDFKSCIDKLKYTRLEYEDTEDYLTFADYLAYLDNNNFIDITDELDTLSDQLDKIQIMKSMLKDIKTPDLDLVKLKKVKDYFVENFEGVPSWFAILEDEEDNLTLFSWAAERETTSEDIVAIPGSVREKVKILQKILGALGFPCGVDGMYGNGTDNIFEAFKTFHNSYEDGETLETYVEQPLPGDPNHNESSKETVDFKTLAYMMIDYMAMDKQIAFTALKPDRLTYFSGNEMGAWSGNLDLESIPVVLAEGYVNRRGGVDHSRSQTELTTTWELTSLTNNVTKDNQGNYKIYETDTEGKIVNEVVLFKDEEDMTRIRVNWLVETLNPVTVGSLKGTITLPDGTEYVDSYPLVIHPLYITAYHKEGDKALWDQEIYYYVSKLREGLDIPITRKDIEGTLRIERHQASIPFHMIQAKIEEECGYEETKPRYEPFFDMYYFHMNPNKDRYIIQMKELGESIGIITAGDTVYDIYKRYTKYHDKKLWRSAAKLCYEKISNDNLSNQFLELYLDYGYNVAINWAKKIVLDGLTEEDVQRFYPKAADPMKQSKWFEENVWKYIRTVSFEEDGEVVDEMEVNFNGLDDFNLQFVKPNVTDTDQRWNKKWEESEYTITFKNGIWEVKDEKSNSLTKNNKEFRRIIREIIKSETNYIKEGTNIKKTPIEVLKDFLEIYITYEHSKAINWYEQGLQDKYDPRVYWPKPFIAQTVISASYGPSQAMYLSAWRYGYHKDPTTSGGWVIKL